MAEQKKTTKKKSQKNEIITQEFNDLSIKEGLEYLKNSYGYIELRIEDEFFQLKEIPEIIHPASLIEDPHQYECVYPIYDFGDRMVAVKDGMAGQSMLKMNFTIEKIVNLWCEKIQNKEQQSGKTAEEVHVYMDGHLFCLRKAFEVIINLTQNWIVMNFDPGEWGNRYLETLQKLYQRGFAYPSAAPRDFYRHVQQISNNAITIPGKS